MSVSTDINVELRSLEAMIDRSFRVASAHLTQDDLAEVERGFRATMHRSRTAGEVKFVKEWEQNDTGKRNFDGVWEPNKKARKTLAKALWSLAMAFGHIHTGYRIFSKVRASQVSPDGLMGGRGFIKSVREMRSKLAEAVEILSDVTDTLHDDLNGPHYQDRASEDTKKLLSEAQEVMDNPDQVDEVEAASTVADDVAEEADASPASDLGEGAEKQAFTRRIASRVARKFVADQGWPSHYWTREHQNAPTEEPELDLPSNQWSGAFSAEVPLSSVHEEDVQRLPTYGVGPRDDGTNPWTY